MKQDKTKAPCFSGVRRTEHRFRSEVHAASSPYLGRVASCACNIGMDSYVTMETRYFWSLLSYLLHKQNTRELAVLISNRYIHAYCLPT